MIDLIAFDKFQVARLPEILFGKGRIAELPDVVTRYGKRALLVTGHSALRNTPHWGALVDGLRNRGIDWQQVRVLEEPSPQLVDETVAEHRPQQHDVVIGIGGGSVLDAAKAIAGLLRTTTTALDHLEGVGRGLPYEGPSVPFIAAPTTAGTGSEATKNAVLSQRGPQGYKKSFRDAKLVAEVAIIDPGLLASCPKTLIAANGMDAFTQLLESYVSLGASPFTDALAASGLRAFAEGFWMAWEEAHPQAAAGFERLAYASLCSGITLAQCGLGSVHGLASPLGAFFPIPHGVVCGTLVAAATRVNIEALRARDATGTALRKYAEAAILLTGGMHSSETAACDALVATLEQWSEHLQLPRLANYGVTEQAVPEIVAHCRGGSMRTNPIELTDQELAQLVLARL